MLKYALGRMRCTNRQMGNYNAISISRTNNYVELTKLAASKEVRRADIAWEVRTLVKLLKNTQEVG